MRWSENKETKRVENLQTALSIIVFISGWDETHTHNKPQTQILICHVGVLISICSRVRGSDAHRLHISADQIERQCNSVLIQILLIMFQLCFLVFFIASLFSFTPLQLLKIGGVFFFLLCLFFVLFPLATQVKSRAVLSSLAWGIQMLRPALYLTALPGALLTSGLWEFAKSRTKDSLRSAIETCDIQFWENGTKRLYTSKP